MESPEKGWLGHNGAIGAIIDMNLHIATAVAYLLGTVLGFLNENWSAASFALGGFLMALHLHRLDR